MSDILCVTNRRLCQEDFLTRIEKIAACRPAGIILREKDLSLAAYVRLAKEVLAVCGQYGVRCILHSFPEAARELGADEIHLPLPLLRQMDKKDVARFIQIGASCHSIEEAREAWRLGCTYITAGHIFETDCKKGVPGRGISFLEAVCAATSLPVYAIGGIGPRNIGFVRAAGAAGVCLMRSLMESENVQELLKAMEGAI
ncbi:MAG: thiamine phosphate synthase [Clostridiales bacterium]|nr:thiamine phosphate synthase [Clostridiales bacterium]